MPNGLVPQAPVHTDACTDYRDKLVVIRTDDDESGHEIRQKVTYPAAVVEQRVSHFVMALAIIGTMTGPLLVVLHTIPRALFAGVFFIVGLGGLLGSNILSSLIFLTSERRFLSPTDPRLALPRSRIFFFVMLQILAVAVTVAISQTIGAIGFPVLITSLIPLRWVVMPMWFSAEELSVLDALTADNPVVLASLGGMPKLPEDKNSKSSGGKGDRKRSVLAQQENMKKGGNGGSSGLASPAETAVGDDSDDAPINKRPQGMLKKRIAEKKNGIPNTREEEKEKQRTGQESATRERVGKIDR